MYRHSEAECDIKDTDSIPQEWEDIENKPKYDCLSQDATKQVSRVQGQKFTLNASDWSVDMYFLGRDYIRYALK